MQPKPVAQVFENNYPLPVAAHVQLWFQYPVTGDVGVEGKRMIAVWGREQGVIPPNFDQLQQMFLTPFITNCKW